MDVLSLPPANIAALLAELEYEPEAVDLPGEVGSINILTAGTLPIELLVLLQEQKAEISGRRVWPGSVLLALSLADSPPPIDVRGLSVLELGGGGGLVGIVCAKLGAREVMIKRVATCA
jgi:hypothetical protein